MTKVARALCAAVLTVVMVSCSNGAAKVAQIAPTPIATADFSGTGPGSLIEAMSMPNIDRKIRALGAKAVRVVYRSTSGIDDTPTEVSAAVFIPTGTAPPGGWPVIAYAHGTSGINNDCGPSLSPDLYGAATLITQYLKLGFAVAATDYQGLGHPGAHPYLDAKTAGLNVIDSVRALRAVSKDVSTSWGVFGGSQGGGASWAANEQATTYATDLNLVGTVALVPAADISGFAAAAATQTLTKDQQAAYIWVLMGLQRTRPDFPIDDYRHGQLTQDWDALSICTGPRAEERARALNDLNPADLVPTTPEAEQRLTDLLTRTALPQQPTAAPMQVIYGGKDSYINPEWTTTAIDRACALGDTIDAILQPDKGHGERTRRPERLWLGLLLPCSRQPEPVRRIRIGPTIESKRRSRPCA